jgi:hypothetical protein
MRHERASTRYTDYRVYAIFQLFGTKPHLLLGVIEAVQRSGYLR